MHENHMCSLYEERLQLSEISSTLSLVIYTTPKWLLCKRKKSRAQTWGSSKEIFSLDEWQITNAGTLYTVNIHIFTCTFETNIVNVHLQCTIHMFIFITQQQFT